MTRTLAITERQAKTLLRAANEEGGVVEVQTAIGIIRLIPAVLARREEVVDDEPKGHM